MSNNFLKSFVYFYGIKASKVNKVYKEVLDQAYSLGQENSLDFVSETMKVLIDADPALCTKHFVESDFNNFDDFIESLFDETLISTNFSPSERPETYTHKQKSVTLDFLDDEEEEEE